MGGSFDSPDWHSAIAEVIRAEHYSDVAASLTRAIDAIVEHDGTCMLAFHRDARPDVIHHSLDPAGARHYVDRYLEGPYLLDPLYQLALDPDCPQQCRFRDRTPDRFRSSEYYRQYCESTHLHDEMDYLLPIDDVTTVALVIGRMTRLFRRPELDRLQLMAPTVLASFPKIWRSFAAGERT